MRDNALQQKEISTEKSPHMEMSKWTEFWGSRNVDLPVWFLEFSPDQNNFHVDSLNRILMHNRNACKSGKSPGYLIIAGPMTHEAAFTAIKSFKYLIEKEPNQ